MKNRSFSWLVSTGLVGSFALAASLVTARSGFAQGTQAVPSAPPRTGVTPAGSAVPARPQSSASPKGVAAAPSAPVVSTGVANTPATSASALAVSGAGLAPPTVAPAAVFSPPVVRKTTAPAPAPTPEQIAALDALKAETLVYAKGAADYSDTVTKIVRLHYEEKKKEILTGLDKDIAIERAELKKTRDVAIQRLEEFVAKYSGSHAEPEATPDAMYRLAAHYEAEVAGYGSVFVHEYVPGAQ